MPRPVLFALACSAAFALALPAHAAAFMKLGDIKGEATGKEHKEWIVISSLSCMPPSAAGASPKLGEIVVTRASDSSSAALSAAAARGARFASAKIAVTDPASVRSSGGVRYEMKEVIISSFQAADGGGAERMTLSAGSIAWTRADGTSGAGCP